MSREIPGSAFEHGEGERRTWDEMGWWKQPFSAGEDDYLADDRLDQSGGYGEASRRLQMGP